MRYLLIPALALIPCLAHAQPSPEQVHRLCTQHSETAEAIMQSRQAGMPLSEAKERVHGITDNEIAQPLHELAVDMAYDEPRHDDEKQARLTTNWFRDVQYRVCEYMFED